MPRLRAIAKIGEPILRQPTQDVPLDQLGSATFQDLIDDLIATMRHANGAGLAANQIFEPWRICVMEVDGNPRYPYKPTIPLTVLVNPLLTPIGDETFENFEGCLSVPDLRGVVRRHARLSVRAYDRHGCVIETEVAGVTAGTYQHEVDHLDAKLFVDRVTDTSSLCTWAVFRRDHEAGFREHVRSLVETYGS